MRRAGRKDATQAAIVQALRQLGITVLVSNQAYWPDLLTYWRGAWQPIEVKVPGGRLTRGQQQLQRLAPYPVVCDVPSALALFGVNG